MTCATAGGGVFSVVSPKVIYTENEQTHREVPSEGSQSRQRVKYGHQSCGTQNQESLCW
jgi:hypothetical protein